MIMCSSWDASASRYQRCSRCSTTSLGSAIGAPEAQPHHERSTRLHNYMSTPARTAYSAFRDQRAEHVLHDPAVPEVVRLAGRVDPDDGLELPAVRADRDLAWHRARVDLLDAGHVEQLAAGEAERGRRLPRPVLQGKDTHPDQVGPVDPL